MSNSKDILLDFMNEGRALPLNSVNLIWSKILSYEITDLIRLPSILEGFSYNMEEDTASFKDPDTGNIYLIELTGSRLIISLKSYPEGIDIEKDTPYNKIPEATGLNSLDSLITCFSLINIHLYFVPFSSMDMEVLDRVYDNFKTFKNI